MSYWDGNKKSLQLRKRVKAASKYVNQLLPSPEVANESRVMKYVPKFGTSRN